MIVELAFTRSIAPPLQTFSTALMSWFRECGRFVRLRWPRPRRRRPRQVALPRSLSHRTMSSSIRLARRGGALIDRVRSP